MITNKQKAVICNFTIDSWPVEIFGQQISTKKQNAYRHMIVEYQLLQLHGEKLRQQVINFKKRGIKTEPAFAKALHIQGDPYEELLKLGDIKKQSLI